MCVVDMSCMQYVNAAEHLELAIINELLHKSM